MSLTGRGPAEDAASERVRVRAASLDAFAARPLEFAAVQRILERHAATSLGVRALREIAPRDDEGARAALARAAEMIRLARGGELPPLAGVSDPVPALEHARHAGRALDEERLVALRSFLAATTLLAEWLAKRAQDVPANAALAQGLSDFSALTETMEATVDERGRVRDHASPLLWRLRKEADDLARTIDRALRDIVGRAEIKAVLSDPNPVRRGGRMVLAVKAKSSGRVPGIVHDRSQSGESVFVEPREIVLPGNRLAEHEADLRREVERILLELTRTILDARLEIELAAERMGELELALIGARYALETRTITIGVAATSVSGGEVSREGASPLVEARGAGASQAEGPVSGRTEGEASPGETKSSPPPASAQRTETPKPTSTPRWPRAGTSFAHTSVSEKRGQPGAGPKRAPEPAAPKGTRPNPSPGASAAARSPLAPQPASSSRESVADASAAAGRRGAVMRVSEAEEEIGARVPLLPGERGATVGMLIRSARHPLLVEEQRLGRLAEVVPIDLRLGDDFDLLILTGPNTGGKTLALKTAGLFALMVRCGLPVPCADGSTIPLYDGIVADIGDEQEISQSLSTFSSHLVRIKAGLERATPATLVLLDELGGGTDPDEGAALSEAILERFLERRAPTLASTHIGKLKEFAFRHQRAENASVEFDTVTLAPRYRILVGTPGESGALVIARRLGLGKRLVERAQERLVRRDGEVVKLMADVRIARTQAEKVRSEAETRLGDVARAHEEIEAKKAAIERRGELLEAEAQKGIEERVRAARKLLEAAFALLDQLPAASKKDLEELLVRLDDELSGTALSDRRRAFLDSLSKGSYVYLPRYKQRVAVLKVDRAAREVTVQLGKMRMKVSFDEVASGDAR